ncbi:MAG: hypothetical protein H8E13_21775 [Actinobacteria bacterium]|nr:hypothetical protein [Actinomycetota bacterium]
MNKYSIKKSGKIITFKFSNLIKYDIKNFFMNVTKINPDNKNSQDFEEFIFENKYSNPDKPLREHTYKSITEGPLDPGNYEYEVTAISNISGVEAITNTYIVIIYE